MAKVGRPTKYREDMCEEYIDLSRKGMSITQIAAEWDIWRDTLWRWTKEYPDFSNAVKRGTAIAEAYWEKVGQAMALGKLNGNPTTFIFYMKNRFKWSDRQEIDQNVNANVTYRAVLDGDEDIDIVEEDG